MKLHQVLPLRKSVNDAAHTLLTRVHHKLSATAIAGISKVYRPKDEDGDRYPNEYQKVTWSGEAALAEALPHQVRLLDLTAMRDFTNSFAKADVVVDDNVVIANAPVPFLLWLEQQLNYYVKVLQELPLLDPGTNWEWNGDQGVFASDPVETVKTKKIEVPLLLAPATDKHPAQVKVTTVDELQGYWTTVRYSGAFRRDDITQAIARARKLYDAVRAAQSLANEQVVAEVKPGKTVVDFVFGGLLHGE